MTQHEDKALPRRAITAAVVTSLVPATGYAATAARVDFTVGDVTRVDKSGTERRLRKGSVVSDGDTIITAARGRAQLRFTDGSRTALLPNTEFRVDEYRFDGQEDENSRSFFSLFKGGLRTITGAIGRLRKQSYRVQTPVATIGIRGTEYLLVLGDSYDMWVGAGGVLSTNEAGSFFCSGFCYVPDQRSPMRNVEGQPFYSAPPLDKPRSSEEAGSSGEPSADVINVTTNDPRANSVATQQARALQGTQFVVGAAFKDDQTANAFRAEGGDLATVSFGSPPVPGAVTPIVGYNVGDTSAQIGPGAQAVEAGVAGPLDGPARVGWTRWVGGTYLAQGDFDSYDTSGCCSPCDVESRSLAEPFSHHVFAIDPPTPDDAALISGVNALFVYGVAGATTPTSSNQPIVPGTDRIVGGQLVFNTNTLRVSVQDMRVVAGNGTYDITLNMSSSSALNSGNNFTFTGSASVTDNSPDNNFSMSGNTASFAGGLSAGFTNAATAYEAKEFYNNTTITGVTAWQQTDQLACPPPCD